MSTGGSGCQSAENERAFDLRRPKLDDPLHSRDRRLPLFLWPAKKLPAARESSRTNLSTNCRGKLLEHCLLSYTRRQGTVEDNCSALSANSVDRCVIAVCWTKSIPRIHRREHRVVDIDAFAVHIQNVIRFEATVCAADRMEHS